MPVCSDCKQLPSRSVNQVSHASVVRGMCKNYGGRKTPCKGVAERGSKNGGKTSSPAIPLCEPCSWHYQLCKRCCKPLPDQED